MSYRRTKGLFAAVALLTTLLWSATALAGGWTQDEGEGYAKIWGLVLVGNSAYLANGDIEEVDDYTNLSLNYYAEYGVASEWTLVASGRPAGWATYGDSETGLAGPYVVGLRRALLEQPLALAVEARYGWESGIGEENLAAADASVSYVPSIRSHRVEYELQAGKGLPFGWVTAHAGTRFYSRALLEPEFIAFAQLGVQMPWDIVTEAHLVLNMPAEDVEKTNVAGAGNTEYLGIGVGISKWFTDHVGVNFTLDGVTYAESNSATPAFLVGLELR